ncbi:MAG: ribonuclease Z [Wenyingzhuangia sp.]|jgi:hypothetical protein|uniref:ribonuclease Z n=1 Tax=Wenyingzhuangia sp. TaxID=1964193 RepID=UPI00321A842F
MKIKLSEKFTLFTAEIDFNTFFEKSSKALENHNNQNIVLDITSIEVTKKDINLFVEFAKKQIDQKKSFAIVLSAFDADDFSEILNVVPSLTEAIDIIDMDEMSRDLGF